MGQILKEPVGPLKKEPGGPNKTLCGGCWAFRAILRLQAEHGRDGGLGHLDVRPAHARSRREAGGAGHARRRTERRLVAISYSM